jgi:hypothetical protein
MLTHVNDMLHPHGFEDIVKDDFAALRQTFTAASLMLVLGKIRLKCYFDKLFIISVVSSFSRLLCVIVRSFVNCVSEANVARLSRALMIGNSLGLTSFAFPTKPGKRSLWLTRRNSLWQCRQMLSRDFCWRFVLPQSRGLVLAQVFMARVEVSATAAASNHGFRAWLNGYLPGIVMELLAPAGEGTTGSGSGVGCSQTDILFAHAMTAIADTCDYLQRLALILLLLLSCVCLSRRRHRKPFWVSVLVRK